MNKIILTGRLTKAPELNHYGEKSTANTKFTLAVDRDRRKKLEEEGKQATDFITVSVWGPVAENCSKYLDKSRLVLVEGSLQINRSEKDGKTSWFTEVAASRVEFLDFGNKSEKNGEQGGDFQEYFPDDDDELPF